MKISLITFFIVWFFGSFATVLYIVDEKILKDSSKDKRAAWIVFWWILALFYLIDFIRLAAKGVANMYREIL